MKIKFFSDYTDLLAQAKAMNMLINSLEGTITYYRSMEVSYNEAIATLNSEREMNRILTDRIEALLDND